MASKVGVDNFGKTEDGRAVTRYSLSNSKGVCVKIIDYGGIIAEILTPDSKGEVGDITLGFDSVKDYENNPPYFGALCGRVANRIAEGKFTLEGQSYQICVNNGPNSLHGGKEGFNKKLWSGEVKGETVVLKYVSPDGEENYPGELTTTVIYSLDEDSRLKIEYESTTTKTTILNVTNHAYFNLAGHDCGHINDHVMIMHADSYLPLNEHSIPLGEVRKVEGTAYDMRSPVKLGDRLSQVPGGIGFDTNYCLDNNGKMKLATRVEHPPSGRYLEAHTTEPGMQLYTAFYLDGFTAKGGAIYPSLGGFALEAQHYPNSINQPEFPSTILHPGETYRQTTVYKFGVL